MKKRDCQHQCMSATQKKEQCKNKVLLTLDKNHHVIWFQNQWASLCPLHFTIIFDYLMNYPPVVTNEGVCSA
jgi:hypothetical protein